MASCRSQLLIEVYANSWTAILKENMLHSVCLNSSANTVKCILECKHHDRTHELVVVQDDKGKTTLHCASESYRTDTVKCLLDFIPPEEIHKTLMVKDLKGRTSIQRGIKKDFADIAKCMLDCVPEKRR